MATDHNTPGGPHLALVGLMGAGKSEVGSAVARRRSLRHLDLDVLVTGREGRSVGVLFEEQGESGFRDCEQAALAEVLSLAQPVVLSTGGGVLERPANRELLSERATVVWLRA
ncbi:MAG: shikimate kinase, partial [Acidimicrobiales bacterium]|nr:shikimate kinase [Acidimicrobiales bacterium]